MEFLKIDLDEHNQPALARLTDIQLGETSITEARFNKGGVTITRFGSDRKPKQYHLNWIEMLALKKAAETYCKAIEAHAVAEEAHREAAIAEAITLIENTKFDYEKLNIFAMREGYGWHVICRAIAMERHPNTVDLVETIQEMLATIQEQVEYAEKMQWGCAGNEWEQIIASYRRVFPLEPQEIVQARKLLKEIMHPADWADASIYPTSDGWHFQDGEAILYTNLPPAEMLTNIHTWLQFAYAPQYVAYLERKQSDAMKQEVL